MAWLLHSFSPLSRSSGRPRGSDTVSASEGTDKLPLPPWPCPPEDAEHAPAWVGKSRHRAVANAPWYKAKGAHSRKRLLRPRASFDADQCSWRRFLQPRTLSQPDPSFHAAWVIPWRSPTASRTSGLRDTPDRCTLSDIEGQPGNLGLGLLLRSTRCYPLVFGRVPRGLPNSPMDEVGMA